MPDLQERIVAHHVGARGFQGTLRCPDRLAKDVIHFVYEADEECAREMIAANMDENFHVLPYCLGRRNEPGKLYICKNPYFSSNLAPNPAYANYYCEVHLHGLVDGVDLQGECYDVDYGGDMRIVRVAEVAVRTLDSILESGDVPKGCGPDFLSLDTQGSELAILLGGENAVRVNCLALVAEVEFHPLYKDQPLFSDVFDFAYRHGFHFAGFTHLQEFSSNRLPLGARDKGFIGFGDALFLRSIDSVAAMAKPKDEHYLCLLKLGFIALNFGYLDYAMQAVDAAEALAPPAGLRDRLAAHGCYKLLYELRAAVAKLPKQFPYQERGPMTDEVKKLLAAANLETTAGAQQPPEVVTYGKVGKPRLRERMENAVLRGRRFAGFARANPRAAVGIAFRHLARPLSSLRLVVAASESNGTPSAAIRAPRTPSGANHWSPPVTAVEVVLEEYGYPWLADSVRRRRKSAENSVAGQMYR